MLNLKGKLRFSRYLILPPLISVCSVLITLFVLFTLLEAFPILIDTLPLGSIRYYSRKRRFSPDKDLVFVRRGCGSSRETGVFTGDLYRSEYGLNPSVFNYTASYNANGFRTNSSLGAYDVVIIGDSYIEIGEADNKTLSEQLKKYSGFRTCNLGREWYGPYQYVKVLQRYALGVKPRFALFCFFSGNDIEDIQQYENWLHGGDYYNFALSRSFLGRFQAVLSDLFSLGLKETRLKRLRTKIWMVWNDEKLPPYLGIVTLGAKQVPMAFCYRNPPGIPEELINQSEWITLRILLAKFRDVCRQHEILPVAVYIPYKMEVYAGEISDQSGRYVRNYLANHLASIDNSDRAFCKITTELNINLIDLTAAFREAAKKGALLYYPFDTHWNLRGRIMAAKLLASGLRELEARDQPTKSNK